MTTVRGGPSGSITMQYSAGGIDDQPGDRLAEDLRAHLERELGLRVEVLSDLGGSSDLGDVGGGPAELLEFGILWDLLGDAAVGVMAAKLLDGVVGWLGKRFATHRAKGGTRVAIYGPRGELLKVVWVRADRERIDGQLQVE